MRNDTLLSVVCLVASVFLHNCTTSVSGVETTNGYTTVVATTTTIEGTAPPQSSIYLCDTGYIPYIDSGVGFMTSADPTGMFQFIRRHGGFTITIISPRGEVAGVSTGMLTEDNGSLRRQLEPPGSISGSVIASPSDSLLVYCAGLAYYQVVTGSETFRLKNLPAGSYQLKIGRLTGDDHMGFTLLDTQPITVRPGVNLTVDALHVTNETQ